MKRAKKIRFEAEIIMGHKNIAAVLVPFAPERVWGSEPVLVDGYLKKKKMPAHLVTGTLDGTPFEGWIGHRWGRRFIIVDQALRKRAGVAVGDVVEMVVSECRRAAPEPPAPASGTRSPSRGRRSSSAPGRRARSRAR
jgi:hypothetical protein